MKSALLIRLDKIGDLVLTLPADQQTSLANYQCTWIVSSGMGFVPQHALPLRNYFELKKEFTWKNWLALREILRKIKPDVTVSFQAPWWVNLCVFLFGVKNRIGVLSKWHSFLFLNNGVRQKRSDAIMNELKYNHQLVHSGMKDKNSLQYPQLQLQAQLNTPLPSLPAHYIVVHPGMTGSARNWPISNYTELIKKISQKYAVVITGTKVDSLYITPLQQALYSSSNIYWLHEKLSSEQFLLVLSKATHVIAPSTGALHLAASLGTPVTGIYSPVIVQKETRWGPQGKNTRTLTPMVDCPAHFSCLNDKCPHFDCMKLVTAEEVYQTVGIGL